MFPAIAFIEAAVLLAASSGGLLPGTAEPAQAIALFLCWAAASYYCDLYDLGVVRRFSDFATRLPRAIAWSLILAAILWGLAPGARTPAGAAGRTAAVMLATILLLHACVYAVARCRSFRERVVILGTGALARSIAREIESRPHRRCDVVAFAGDIDGVVRETRPHRIVVALAGRRGRVPVRQLVELKVDGVAVDDGEEFYERLTGRISLESLAPSSFLFGSRTGRSRLHIAAGRAISLVLSAAGLVMMAPLFPLIALAIRFEGPGPIFYVQDRIGRRGRRFRMLKFRTMRPVEREQSAWAGDNGHRITRVGAWLRKFRLDELPQFVNILRGDMNLVGPRPHPVSNFRLFAEKIPHYELRLTVRPGVTGWAQIRHGYADNLEEETEKMCYDLYYIKHVSLWLDLRILFGTFKVVLLGRRSLPSRTLPAEARENPSDGVRDTAA